MTDSKNFTNADNFDESKSTISTRLTAYALGELSPDDPAEAALIAEVEAHLADNPEARAMVEDIRRIAGLLETDLAAEPADTLTDDQRQAIHAAADTPADAPAKPKKRFRIGTWAFRAAALLLACLVGATAENVRDRWSDEREQAVAWVATSTAPTDSEGWLSIVRTTLVNDKTISDGESESGPRDGELDIFISGTAGGEGADYFERYVDYPHGLVDPWLNEHGQWGAEPGYDGTTFGHTGITGGVASTGEIGGVPFTVGGGIGAETDGTTDVSEGERISGRVNDSPAWADSPDDSDRIYTTAELKSPEGELNYKVAVRIVDDADLDTNRATSGEATESDKDRGGRSGGRTTVTATTVTGQPARPVAAVDPRKVVYTADVRIATVEVETAAERTRKLAETFGGYMQVMTKDAIVIRVPVESFDAAMKALAEMGTVVHQRIQAHDVTEVCVDLQIRLKNAQVLLSKLHALVKKAKDVEKALAIEKEIARLQTTIEQLQGQLNVLSNRVSYATISVSFMAEQHIPAEMKVRLPFGWLDGLGVENLMSF
jgi:hypothetical protein